VLHWNRRLVLLLLAVAAVAALLAWTGGVHLLNYGW
jgi:hypothetical protein